MFTYEQQLESYKKEIRQSILDFFQGVVGSASSVTEDDQLQEFDKIYDTFLAKAKKDFPPRDIEKEIAQVYENSHIIKKKCQIDINVKNETPTVRRCKELKIKLQTGVFCVNDPTMTKSFLQMCHNIVRVRFRWIPKPIHASFALPSHRNNSCQLSDGYLMLTQKNERLTRDTYCIICMS